MRLGLRWKILTLTALPLAGFGAAAAWIVERGVSRHMEYVVGRDLERSAGVIESALAARARELAVAGRVIARDPRFFSALAPPAAGGGNASKPAVARAARTFNAITRADLFDVFDARGRLVAWAGREPSDRAAMRELVAAAVAGAEATAIAVQGGRIHVQAAAFPVTAGGRVIGALLIGSFLGPDVARRLRSLTRGDVTFVSERTVTATTLGPDARDALRGSLGAAEAPPARGPFRAGTGFALAGALPGTPTPGRDRYVIQRSLDAEAAALAATRAGLVRLALLAAAAALVAGLLVAHGVVSPVRRLVRAAEAMERGDYDHPLPDAAGGEIGYLAGRFREMRERHRDYVRGLQEVTRVKSEFIAVASRRLATPIDAIGGFRRSILDGATGPVTPPQRHALDAMGASLDALRRIADDASRLSQIEGDRLILSPRDHEVGAVVEEGVLAALALARGRAVTVVRRVDPALGVVRVDGSRLSQAIASLVSNGIRFTPDGGRVEVGARRDGDELVIEVRDTGVGIDVRRQREVVEGSAVPRSSLHHHSSSTLEFNSAGIGLGLSIVRGIVDAHGGALRVESAPGRGTVFAIRVPVEDRPRALAA